MRFVSWNVNGLRACINKGWRDFFDAADADVFALQETKLQPDQIELELSGYHMYWNSAERKGYSGTAVFAKQEPLAVTHGMGMPEHDTEGRVLTLEYPSFYYVDCYTPNSQRELTRLAYRMQWEDDFRAYLCALDQKKPVILSGDLNVARSEIDLKNPASNHKNAGFTDEERAKMQQLLDEGFVDTFRALYPEKKDAYTWWSYMFKSRERNAGWRIDYFIVSERLLANVRDSVIHADIMGSDHCPIALELDV